MKQGVFIFLTLCILSFGCGTTKSSLDEASKGNEQIPGNFNPGKSILLIEQSVDEDNSSVSVSTTYSVRTDTYMNAYMRKNRRNMMDYADQHYSYKHEFASQDQIYNSNSKFNDKNLYRYALVTSLVKPNQYTAMNNNGTLQSTHYQPIFKFYLYDRLTDKTYAALGHGSSLIMWAFKSAIQKLNGIK